MEKQTSQFWMEFGRKMDKWPTNCVHWLYHNVSTVSLLGMAAYNILLLLGCEWSNFLSQNRQTHWIAGTTSWHHWLWSM